MTVMTDALIPALEDAREAHAAVIDRFRADMAFAPVGPHRQTLERHIVDAQDHIARLDDLVREIRPRRLLRDTAEMARLLAQGAVRTAMMPVQAGALMVGGVRGGRPATEWQLLKNAEDEYTAAARALAACRAGESIAALTEDEQAEELLGSLRRQDEQLLQTLEYSVDERARNLAAVAAANGGFQSQTDGGLAGAAARVVRTTVDRVREAALTGGQQARRTAAGAAQEMPSATKVAEQVQGAVTREEDLPIPGYGRLTVTDITARLRTLSQADLTVLEGYERAHANRAGVLNAIGQLRGSEPWPGYDTMSPDQITARLQTAEPALTRRVEGYEQRHRQRQEIATAARQRTGTTA